MRLLGRAVVPGIAEGTVVPGESWDNADLSLAPPDRSRVWVGPAGQFPTALELGREQRPAAMVLPDDESPHIPAPPPTVGRLDPGLFHLGDRVLVDGTTGTVDLEGVRAVEVVTSFLEDVSGRVLILRRSGRVGSFQGRWAGVSGFLESAFPIDQAKQEIREETGVSSAALELAREAEVVYARSGDRVFVVHPFRFRLRKPVEIQLDWEHTEFAWVRPEELEGFPTVPGLGRVWRAVAPLA